MSGPRESAAILSTSGGVAGNSREGARNTWVRKGTTAFAALVCAGVISLASPGAGSQGVSIRVSPASITAAVRDGDTIGPVLVTNRGTSAVDVQGSCEMGGHDQAGVPVHHAIKDPGAVAVYITLDPAEFRLPPGGSRPVYAKVHVNSGFSGGAYPIILFRARRAEGPPEGDISAASQVAVLTLLTVAPRSPVVRLEAEPVLTSLAVEGNADRNGIRVIATCENAGNIHASLSGVVLLRDCDGNVTAQGALASAMCLPGCARTLSGLVDAARLRKGTYIAEVRLTAAGRAADSALIAFRVLDGMNVASTRIDLRGGSAASHGGERPKAPRIARLTVPAVSEGRDLPLEVTLESPDSSLIDPIGYVEIWDYQMKRAGVVALQGASTAPGDLTVIRLTWPEALSPGYYTARATLQWRSKRLSVSTPFVVGGGITLGSKR
ncbi:MAG: hypothetical protein PWR07_383 [Bacillota bacterium]|nr:hypothetical protein [Bacillota bacterium]MDK2930252.1 hypothetical protein [Bacillota bacterium]